MKTKKKTKSFLERKDGDTAKLVEFCETDISKVLVGVCCNEGERHDVVEIDQKLVEELEYCASLVQLEYRLFIQRDGDVRMKRMPLREKKAHTPKERKGIIAKLHISEQPLALSGEGRTIKDVTAPDDPLFSRYPKN